MPPGSAVYISEASDAQWGPSEWLLRNIHHQLAAANWQRGGGKGSQPDPMDTPSQADAREKSSLRKKMRAELAKRRHIERMKARRRT